MDPPKAVTVVSPLGTVIVEPGPATVVVDPGRVTVPAGEVVVLGTHGETGEIGVEGEQVEIVIVVSPPNAVMVLTPPGIVTVLGVQLPPSPDIVEQDVTGVQDPVPMGPTGLLEGQLSVTVIVSPEHTVLVVLVKVTVDAAQVLPQVEPLPPP